MNLGEELQRYDGRQVKQLEQLAELAFETDASVDDLIVLADDDQEKMQRGATWILKRMAESDVAISKSQTTKLLNLFHRVTDWEAKLHLLQILNRVQIPSRGATGLFRTLKELLCEENKFVRAWAYDGLAVLGEQHERFRDDVRALIEDVRYDDSAAVRARVRKICKASPWTGEPSVD